MKKLMKIKHLLILVAALAFVCLVFAWNMCLPHSCEEDPVVCSDGNCFESFSQRVDERSILSNITFQSYSSLFALILFVLFKIFENELTLKYFSLVQKLRYSKNRFIYKLYNIFVVFFARGILHPKAF